MINHTGRGLNVIRTAALALAAFAVAASLIVGTMPLPLWAQSTPRTSDESASIQTKEVVLKHALVQMRAAIDQYFADKDQYPSSLNTLVREGYISQIPTDPITNRIDSWQTIRSKPAPDSPAAATGISDLRSGSERTALDGTKHSAW